MDNILISSPSGILAVLAFVASFFFYLEKKTKWNIFNFLPPLIFIYLIPVLLSNTAIIPAKSGVYDFMGSSLLPMFLTIMLLDVDIRKTIKVMGKSIFVMLAGTLGVVVGAPIALLFVKHALGESVWKAFGVLAGSWIGGTGNMLAVGTALNLDESSLDFGYAIIADNAVYLIWLPLLLASKSFADKFNKFTKMPEGRVKELEAAAKDLVVDKGPMEMRHFLYLLFIGFSVTALSSWIAGMIPPQPPILSYNTYKILLVTFLAIGLSFTKASKIPGSHPFSMAMVYLFVARMGAKADLSGIDLAVFWFLLGAFIWIFIHGAFLLGAAKLLKVDVHTAAIASAANIGGAASAPIVAAYHNPTLVPVSILMALVGYAIGNPAALLAAALCRWIV